MDQKALMLSKHFQDCRLLKNLKRNENYNESFRYQEDSAESYKEGPINRRKWSYYIFLADL